MTAAALDPVAAPSRPRLGRPRLRADLIYRTVTTADGQVVLAVGEGRTVLVENACAAALIDVLDGHHTLIELADAVVADHSVLQVTAALRRLAALDLLVDGPTAVDPGAAAAWESRGLVPDTIAAPRIFLRTLGSAADLGPALRAAGVELEVRSGSGMVEVVSVDSLHAPELAAINRRVLATGRDWWLVRPRGNVLLIGPHLRPGETGCWECLRQRLSENEQVETFLAAQDPAAGRPNIAVAQLPSALAVVASVLATELQVAAAGGRSPVLTGAMLTLDTRTWETSRHLLTRQPQCPACGDPSLTRRLPGPDLLADPRGSGTPIDGGLRVEPAEQTLARLEPLVDPYLGVVSRLAALRPDPTGTTFSYGAGHNFALPSNPTHLRRNLRGQSGGKGRTDIQAKVSAIGEAVERYCGVWRSDRPVRRATRAELGVEAVDLVDLAQFSVQQQRERLVTNASGTMFHRVAPPLPPELTIDWTAAWSLTHQVVRWVPAGYCFYGHPDVTRHQLCVTDSNGCAAGTTMAEATLQGFCELVERDSVALWWYHRSLMPGVDLDAFDDPWIDRLVHYYGRELRRELWALDLTADLGVPTFAAVSRQLGADTDDILVGFGAHPDAAVALGRALTELNQFLPSVARTRVQRGTRPGYAIDDPETVHWLTTARIAEQKWLVPDPARPETTPATHGDPGLDHLDAAVRWCVEVAAQAGLEVLVVDQRRPEIDVAVVKVLVPGLRHFWRRLGPGRLWDVPGRLGRNPLARDETEINPYSVFF